VAQRLSLSFLPVASEAVALIDALLIQVLSHERQNRARQRGAQKQAAFTIALGAVVGGVLKCWAGAVPQYAMQRLNQSTFTGSRVTYRHFMAVEKALCGLDLMGKEGGKSFPVNIPGAQVWQGRVTRYWPTAKLLVLAEKHGLHADLVRRAFKKQVDATVPVVRSPVIFRSFKSQDRRQVLKKADLPVDATDPHIRSLMDQVEDYNSFTASFAVEGCVPPRWHRQFTVDQRLHGRWYASGQENYQLMSEAERVSSIRIAGEPVVEVDVSASHLSILHGLHGLVLPDGDLYDVVPGVPRHVAKAWLTMTLGSGRARANWGRRSTAEDRSYDAAMIRAAMIETYPFLGHLQAVVLEDLRHTYGKETGLVSHYLMGLEAHALTGAMLGLRYMGHLALPMHDGLVVAAISEAETSWSLEQAFWHTLGVRPRFKVTRVPTSSAQKGL
jgi:hypothetical protein